MKFITLFLFFIITLMPVSKAYACVDLVASHESAKKIYESVVFYGDAKILEIDSNINSEKPLPLYYRDGQGTVTFELLNHKIFKSEFFKDGQISAKFKEDINCGRADLVHKKDKGDIIEDEILLLKDGEVWRANAYEMRNIERYLKGKLPRSKE